MNYLLFEHGKVEINENNLYNFYLPLYIYNKNYEFPEGIEKMQPQLIDAIEKIRKNPDDFIGLGIDIQPHNDLKDINLTFKAIEKRENVLNKKYNHLYILATKTILDYDHYPICRYDYARYSDGRWVIYLLREHESHNPVRIPSEE